MFLRLAGTAALILILALRVAKRSRRRGAEFVPVRDAGPACMKDPPEDWDLTDEANDESFPASDPPGGY